MGLIYIVFFSCFLIYIKPKNMPEFRYIVSTDLELNRDEANYLIDCFQSNWETKHHLCEGGKFRGVIGSTLALLRSHSVLWLY